jgi:ABC-type multidrug transport system ATPase subunit
MTHRLRVVDLEIRRRRTLILREFSLEMHTGRIWWIVGENGIGKSTFLRCLAGRLRPRRGRILFDDRRLIPADTAYYHPAMKPPPGATMADLLAFAKSLESPLEGDVLLSWRLERRQRLERLSTGQAKRLTLALLLRTSAPVLLLDEPFDHLSAAGREGLLDRLRLLARERLVLLSTNLGVPQREPSPQVVDFDYPQPCLS